MMTWRGRVKYVLLTFALVLVDVTFKIESWFQAWLFHYVELLTGQVCTRVLSGRILTGRDGGKAPLRQCWRQSGCHNNLSKWSSTSMGKYSHLIRTACIHTSLTIMKPWNIRPNNNNNNNDNSNNNNLWTSF